MAGVQVEPASVVAHVVDTVRDQRPLALAGEVMIVDLDGRLRVDHAGAMEISEQFLLLRVDADHRQAGVQKLLLEPGDVLKLRIAIGVSPGGPHRLGLDRLTPTVAVRVQQGRHRVLAGRSARFHHATGNLAARQVGPLYARPHRVAGRVI